MRLFSLNLILILLYGNLAAENVTNSLNNQTFNDSIQSDHIEETNHSEAVDNLLSNFDKTLEESKKVYELDHVDTAVDNNDIEGVVVGEVNETSSVNEESVLDENESNDNSSRTKLACNNTETLNVTVHSVLMVNATQYQSYLFDEHNSSVSNRSQSATCSITMFYAPWCQFSAEAAPHYNALARVFPQLRLYAVDSSEHHSLNTQFGVMAVPSIFVFHNSRPLYKYNFTEYNLESFTQFVSLLTGLEPENITVTEDDYIGPLPSVAIEPTNYYLILAFLFTLFCCVWQISTSQWLSWTVDTVRNLWREAEIQHQHQD